MEDFRLIQGPTGWGVAWPGGKLVTDWTTQKNARIIFAALNNFVVIANGETDAESPAPIIAGMFLCEIADL